MKKIPVLVLSLLFLIAALFTGGCGAAKETGKAAGGAPGGTLQLYTSQPEGDVSKLIEGFKKKYPQITVNVFRSGTEEVVARINTEIKAGKLGADVMLLADAPTFEFMKEKDLLLSYRSPEAKGIRQELLDPEGMFSPTKMIPTGIMINTDKVKDLNAVDWSTLITQAGKAEAVMPSPLYSGAAAYNVGVFRNQAELGWPYYEKLKANDVMVVKGNGDVLKRVASGERAYGMIVDFMAHRAKAQRSPVAFIYPKSGVTVITEPVAIAKTSQNPEAAKAFVDFILSEEGQKLAVALGYIPVRPGVASPEGRPAAESLKILAAPTKKLMQQREADKKDFSALFGG